MTTIVGLHSESRQEDDRMNTHSWISVTENGKTETYGLYPERSTTVREAGATPHGNPGSNVYKGLDDDRMPKVAAGDKDVTSTYHEMTPADKENLDKFIKQDHKWEKENNNCAHFASDAYAAAGGKHYSVSGSSPDGVGGRYPCDCPQGLSESIKTEKVRDNAPTATAAPGPSDAQTSGVQSKFMSQAAPNPEVDFNKPLPEMSAAKPEQTKSLTEEFNSVR